MRTWLLAAATAATLLSGPAARADSEGIAAPSIRAQAGFARRAGTELRDSTAARGDAGENPPPAMRRQAR